MQRADGLWIVAMVSSILTRTPIASPFEHHVEDVPPEEMEKRMAEATPDR